MIYWCDPAEQREARLLAPAVRRAAATVPDACRIRGAGSDRCKEVEADGSEDDAAHHVSVTCVREVGTAPVYAVSPLAGGKVAARTRRSYSALR